jgi:hypothetical protein
MLSGATLLAGCGQSDETKSQAPVSVMPPVATVAGATSVPKCAPHLAKTDVLDITDAKVEVTDYTSSDTSSQSWVSASLNVLDVKLKLTDAQARSALQRLQDRLASSCQENKLQRTRIFLYPAGVVAGASANWLGRLETDGETSTITLHETLLKDDRPDQYACLDKVEPGISLGLGTKLPPVRQRKIIGTWADPMMNLTLSIEKVGKKVYRVRRSAYCSSGDRGELLRAGSSKLFGVIGSTAGDMYEIDESGDLGIFDRDGKIDTLPAHFGLHPKPKQL